MAFDGWAAATLAGGDPLDLPPDRFFSLIYFWIVREGEQSEIEKFDARLWRPPKGVAPAKGSPWSADAETAAFRGLTAQVKGSPVTVG